VAGSGVNARLLDALNRRDADRLVDCFHPDYSSEQPAHPDRAFVGSEQVRVNWSQVFSGVPDFTAELVREADDGTVAWGEWRFSGTRGDGTQLAMAGVIIAGVHDDRIAWARLYLEDVEAGAGIEAAVRDMSGE
jgi:ketosteroid isomerase-like protein